MIADTIDELHAMADAIGMKRLRPRRAVAVMLGAIELDKRSFIHRLREVRNEMDKIAWYKRVAELIIEVWGDCSNTTIADYSLALLEDYRQDGLSPDKVVRDKLK